MKLAIMQPYFFPYLGYYSLIRNTDYFVFFDTPQYIRKGWINRNRILSSSGDSTYFTVPIEKCARETPINQVRIAQDSRWREKIFGQLTIYKKKAPYYDAVIDLVSDVIKSERESISRLAINSIIKCCEFIGIDLKYSIYSEMNLGHIEVKAPDEWAMKITREMKYDTYVNPPGGKSFFDCSKYTAEGIKLEFLWQNVVNYNQHIKGFQPDLSIIDLLMFCKPEDVMDMMREHRIERGESI